MVDYKKIRKRIMLIGLIGIVILTSFILINNQIQVYALSDNLDESTEELIKIYNENEDLFEQNDLVSNGLRSIGVGVLSFFVKFAASANSLFDKSFGMLNFTKYGPVNDFLKEWHIHVKKQVLLRLEKDHIPINHDIEDMVEFAMNRVFDTILQNLDDPFDEVFKALNIMDKFMLCLVVSTHYSRLKL